jgi:hypothetical protein
MKNEHSGAKNGGGHWGTRGEAKTLSKRQRRIEAVEEIDSELAEAIDDAKEAQKERDLKFINDHFQIIAIN